MSSYPRSYIIKRLVSVKLASGSTVSKWQGEAYAENTAQADHKLATKRNENPGIQFRAVPFGGPVKVESKPAKVEIMEFQRDSRLILPVVRVVRV